MNRPSICIVASAIVAAACLLAHGEGQTQNDEYEAPDKLPVAFVDVAQIFKRSTFFKSQMDELKKKADAALEQVNEKQNKSPTSKVNTAQTPRSNHHRQSMLLS
jgi:Sec-independent protein translocase protein TatA